MDAVVFLDRTYVYGLEIAWAGYGRYPLLKDGSGTSINIQDAELPPELASKVMVRPLSEKYSARYLALKDLKAWLVHSK